MIDVDELSPADRRAFYLSHIRSDVENARMGFWPDAAAGGASTDDLAKAVLRLVEIVEEMNGGRA